MSEVGGHPAAIASARQPASFGGHPRALAMLFLVELWERFSYYGMRALLTLFMVAPLAAGGMGLDTVEAARIYGNYTMAVYLLSIPGGFAADYFLGARRAVLIGGSVIACGHFALAIPTSAAFYLGLMLIVLGTGLFKPNISALVGGLYGPGDERRDAGFSIFYMGINIGGLFAPLVTGYLAQGEGFKRLLAAAGLDPAMSWHFGFAAAGFGMTIGLLIFLWRSDRLAGVGDPPSDVEAVAWRRMGLVVVGTGAVLGLILISDVPGFTWLRALFVLGPAVAAVWLARSGDADRQRLAAAMVFFLAAMIFFAVFEQAGLSFALFADQLTRKELLGLNIPSAWFQSLNPLFVILLAPVFAWGWMRLGPRQPSSPIKFVLGMIFLGLSLVLMVPAALLTVEGKVSPLWLVGLFLLQTIGELFLSPVGLSTMTKLAPARLVGLVLGVWFLGAALGNKLAGVLGGGFVADDAGALASFFLRQALLVGVATLLLIALVPWLKRMMRGVR